MFLVRFRKWCSSLEYFNLIRKEWNVFGVINWVDDVILNDKLGSILFSNEPFRLCLVALILLMIVIEKVTIWGVSNLFLVIDCWIIYSSLILIEVCLSVIFVHTLQKCWFTCWSGHMVRRSFGCSLWLDSFIIFSNVRFEIGGS